MAAAAEKVLVVAAETGAGAEAVPEGMGLSRQRAPPGTR